jgi:hypothetical protein
MESAAGAPEARRAAFRAFLGDRKMRVLPDPEQQFRVEGLFELVLETADARAREGRRASAFQVAGERYARVCPLPVSLALPVSGHVELVAA